MSRLSLRGRDVSLAQILPNLVTIAAICAGLTAIRFGLQGQYEMAVKLILAAAVLDALDGRLARLLDGCSPIGSELDSLGDFLNFGVAPALVLYFWGHQGLPSATWLPVLVYAVCAVLRLARFNVAAKEGGEAAGDYFTGVPAPAGALLVMFPLYISFAIADEPVFPAPVIGAHMVLVGLLMISTIPTRSFKSLRIAPGRVKFALLGFAALGSALLTYPWAVLAALCIGYLGLVLHGVVAGPGQDRAGG